MKTPKEIAISLIAILFIALSVKSVFAQDEDPTPSPEHGDPDATLPIDVPDDDATLPTDNWLCKDIGDIVNSTPMVVGSPPFYYPFDGYYGFIRERAFETATKRDSTIYIGANDGMLHAFDLLTGAEKWAFAPKSMHKKLNLAGVDSLWDMCDLGYCHQYFVDGSPQAGDVYADFGSGDEWRTILVTGLREGGESYFALDVTTGKGFDEASADEEIPTGESVEITAVEGLHLRVRRAGLKEG